MCVTTGASLFWAIYNCHLPKVEDLAVINTLKRGDVRSSLKSIKFRDMASLTRRDSTTLDINTDNWSCKVVLDSVSLAHGMKT